MMWSNKIFAALAMVATTATMVNAKPVDNKTRTLVVVDQSVDQDSYQPFFDSLRNRDHNLEIKDAKDEIDLLKFDELNYDNLLVLPTVKTRNLGTKLSGKKLLQFFNTGGNVLAVTGSNSVPESVREFAAELDINISPRGYKLVDHFHGSNEQHDEIGLTSKHNVGPHSILDGDIELTIESASAAYLGNSELVIPLVHADSTAYVYDARDEDEVVKTPWVTGNQAYLAAGLQGNNNARFLWVGSDQFVQKYGEEYSKWCFQEKSVVRSVYYRHHLQGSDKQEKLYKVNEPMHYEIGLQEWNGEVWGPYKADDVQLEFVMLDPYYRLTMNSSQNKNVAVYSADFTLPDQYGMFTFRMEYRRPGISFVEENDVVTVRHIANDEWPRSWEINNSHVYLSSAISVMVAWFVFVLLYLYSGNGKSTSSEKKNQ